jgi:hypothetical protein
MVRDFEKYAEFFKDFFFCKVKEKKKYDCLKYVFNFGFENGN